ncbi:GNAT family N-acetyltransferase [Methylobacterium symbioticum]|uniref:BioF2-like acetyltransferase domain-containing protein n=1 Tax=Methylobacterium symbioticum TaxID=2584084 RepID=A0A509EAK9_9HYPH|nr:GNAT family N-acetyltransferase [Methylobacterium symbioticum]VUD70559.1 hypothetical protein MET9862_01129 [Methylobacterium symbioticum]
MARRFTLIQGGLSEPPSLNPAAEAPRAPLAVDLRGALAVDGEAVAAWRALMTRTGSGDPFQDPDFLLTAAQHQSAGQQIAFALVWHRPASGPNTLHGMLPLRIARPLLARDRAHLWRPPGLPGPAPLIEPERAGAIVAAVRIRLGALARPVELDGDPALLRQDRPPAQAGGHAIRRRGIPPASLLGIRPDGYRPPRVEHVRDPAQVRDAVETFLALDARTARRPIIADPAEAAMVRVVSRLFARRRQISVELARSGGTVVAGTLHLGSGPRAVAWRHAAD